MNPDQISSLVIPQAGSEFSGDDFREWSKPGVYVLLAKDGRPLYVGMGKNGIQRLAHKSFRHIKRGWAFKGCSKIKLFPCISIEAAVELEEYLITRLKPIFNERLKTAHITRLLGIKGKSLPSRYSTQTS